VVIVGAGYTGLAAALPPARAGATVLVLDRESPGWGASGRNGGFVLPGYKAGLGAIARRWGAATARTLFAESLASITHLESLLAREAIACEFRRSGHLALAETPAQVENLRRERDLLLAVAGHPTRLITGDDLAGEIGSPRYTGALLDESAGSLHPGLLVQGLGRSAAGAGVILCGRTEALEISGRPGDQVVETSRGKVRAAHVMVATNGYSGALHPALRRRVIPVGSHIISTTPLGAGVAGRLLPQGRVASDSRHLLHYFRLTTDGRLLFGGRASFRPDRSGEDSRAAAVLSRDMVRIFPPLAGARVDHAWSGNVAFTRDQMPHVAVLDGVLSAAGYCGHGVAMAIYLGTGVGRHLAGGGELPSLASLGFPAVPLYEGRPWFLPLAGAWFQMLDWMRSPS
jgi:glycine/D-amino acid oxidase-like deaminating enzyme